MKSAATCAHCGKPVSEDAAGVLVHDTMRAWCADGRNRAERKASK